MEEQMNQDNSSKQVWWIIFIIIAIAFGIVAGYIFAAYGPGSTDSELKKQNTELQKKVDDLQAELDKKQQGSQDGVQPYRVYDLNSGDTSDWQTYRNTWDSNSIEKLAINFQFQYPKDIVITGSGIYRFLRKETDSNRWLARIWAEKNDGYKDYAYIDDYLVQEIDKFCDADGPGGSIYCKEAFIYGQGDVSGVHYYIAHMKEVREIYGVENQVTERFRGPVYAFDVRGITNNEYSFMYIAVEDDGIEYEGIASILGSIVESIKFTEDLSDWQTFTDDNLNFQYSIPNGYTTPQYAASNYYAKIYNDKIIPGTTVDHPFDAISVHLSGEPIDLDNITGRDCEPGQCRTREMVNGRDVVTTAYGDGGCGFRYRSFNIDQIGVQVTFQSCWTDHGAGITEDAGLQAQVIGLIQPIQ